MTRSVDVREELTEALRLDLVGPRPDGPYADEVLTDRASARRTWFASAIGLSVLLPAEVESLEVRVTWGDYVREKPPKQRRRALRAATFVGRHRVSPAERLRRPS